MSALIQALLLSLALTLLIELPLALLWGFRGRELAVVLLVNVVTNPPAVLLYACLQAYTPLPKAVIQLPIETAVVVSEWLVYRAGTDRRRPFWAALTLNAASYAAGLLWNLL